MLKVYNYNLIHFMYGKEEDDYGMYYVINNRNFCLKLYSDKINVRNNILTSTNKNNLIILGKWLDRQTNLNQDNIYLYIRLKGASFHMFLDWWNEYNFQIKIEEPHVLYSKIERINFK